VSTNLSFITVVAQTRASLTISESDYLTCRRSVRFGALQQLFDDKEGVDAMAFECLEHVTKGRVRVSRVKDERRVRWRFPVDGTFR